MKIGLAYALVVVLWATTPLAIKWSTNNLMFIEAVTARIVLAAIVCLCVLWTLGRPLFQRPKDAYAYLAAAVGCFPNLALVTWSAQYIPSGLVAVVFGLYPFAVGYFSLLILKENIFSFKRIVALFVALLGLCFINIDQFTLGGNALYGVLGILGSTLLFSFSSVSSKALGGDIDPFRLSTGALLFSVPGFLLTCYFMGGDLSVIISAEFINTRSFFSILYLALVGSVFGGALFFVVLKHCSVASVGLITFVTPVLALVVGFFLAGERITLTTYIGSVLVLLALGIYQGLFKSLSVGVVKYCQAHGLCSSR